MIGPVDAFFCPTDWARYLPLLQSRLPRAHPRIVPIEFAVPWPSLHLTLASLEGVKDEGPTRVVCMRIQGKNLGADSDRLLWGWTTFDFPFQIPNILQNHPHNVFWKRLHCFCLSPNSCKKCARIHENVFEYEILPMKHASEIERAF